MKNVVLLITISICSTLGFSQTKTKDIDSKVKFGFNLGTNKSMLKANELLPENSYIVNGYGFQVGLIMDYKLNKNFTFSPKTEISFNNSGVENINNNTNNTYNVFPIAIDAMTHLVYMMGNGKSKPYLLLGPKLSLPIKEKLKSSDNFKTKPDFAIDFGIGLDHKLKYFFLAPELRYSLGLLNINANPVFESLNYHKISFVVNFK